MEYGANEEGENAALRVGVKEMENLQDLYSPNAICFGCGPKNSEGLQIKSRVEGEFVVADWTPEPYHTSFAGYVSGGIISILLDCHGNITAGYSLMKSKGLENPPGTVTSELSIKYLKPTPIGKTLRLKAHCMKIEGSKVYIEGGLGVEGVETVEMKGVYVSVKEGHPAFNKWS